LTAFASGGPEPAKLWPNGLKLDSEKASLHAKPEFSRNSTRVRERLEDNRPLFQHQ